MHTAARTQRAERRGHCMLLWRTMASRQARCLGSGGTGCTRSSRCRQVHLPASSLSRGCAACVELVQWDMWSALGNAAERRGPVSLLTGVLSFRLTNRHPLPGSVASGSSPTGASTSSSSSSSLSMTSWISSTPALAESAAPSSAVATLLPPPCTHVHGPRCYYTRHGGVSFDTGSRHSLFLAGPGRHCLQRHNSGPGWGGC